MPRSSPNATSQSKRNNVLRRLHFVFWLAAGASLVAGCATNVGDGMPASIGGLPADAPVRPEQVMDYPAVHAMPPPRPARMLDEDQQEKLEKDLAAARERQSGRAPASKKPKKSESTGAKPNP